MTAKFQFKIKIIFSFHEHIIVLQNMENFTNFDIFTNRIFFFYFFFFWYSTLPYLAKWKMLFDCPKKKKIVIANQSQKTKQKGIKFFGLRVAKMV